MVVTLVDAPVEREDNQTAHVGKHPENDRVRDERDGRVAGDVRIRLVVERDLSHAEAQRKRHPVLRPSGCFLLTNFLKYENCDRLT